ncbi:hypothetical protein ACFY2M_19390 [Streptomyces sp. NPDC001276]|uniref:hypothetical protein n=1 Tax=Streptomyces sp. NPDC001276 TaxID=3364555 RepID=UPI0036C0BED1
MREISIDLSGTPSRGDARPGDFALYRDPVAWLRGDEQHTRICQIIDASSTRMRLVDLASGETRKDVPRTFVRVIPAGYIMRDIDEAPLAEDHPDLTPAAVAWLRQNAGKQVQDGPAELERGEQR